MPFAGNIAAHAAPGRPTIHSRRAFARRRKFQVILIRHGTHAEGVDEVVATANEMAVPIRYVESRELESFTHGSSHGGMLAICTAKPQAAIADLFEMIEAVQTPPLLLLLEGVDDARNLGFTLRTAEAMGAHAVLIKKHLWDFDETEVARPASGAYQRLPLVQIDDVSPLQELRRRGLKLLGCLATVRQTIFDADLRLPTILAVGGERAAAFPARVLDLRWLRYDPDGRILQSFFVSRRGDRAQRGDAAAALKDAIVRGNAAIKMEYHLH